MESFPPAKECTNYNDQNLTGQVSKDFIHMTIRSA